MKTYKHCVPSSLYARLAHADIFEMGSDPRFLLVFFGGSGVDENEYTRRSKTVIPIFEPVLQNLTNSNLVLAYVCAPYDVPFNRFSEDRAAAETWNNHILSELLAPWESWPYFVCGFSGGTALALHGLHANQSCFGGAVLGADAIPSGFECPNHWPEKLRLYATPNDRVVNHPTNRQIVEDLERRGQIEQINLPAGGHRLVDYVTSDCLGGLSRFVNLTSPKHLGHASTSAL